MIEIVYDEKPCIFDLRFNQKKYISARYFQMSEGKADIELKYFIDLLTKYEMYSPENSSVQMIWSVHYKCKYCGVFFTMVYDEDYGLVSFAVNNSKDRKLVAKAIKSLIEKERP